MPLGGAARGAGSSEELGSGELAGSGGAGATSAPSPCAAGGAGSGPCAAVSLTRSVLADASPTKRCPARAPKPA
ncbi:hypothetical protein BE20_00545 [Sorangium cellulosum]|nr:hypothetical protein BE20_00545 [Sorangium cellulosum]